MTTNLGEFLHDALDQLEQTSSIDSFYHKFAAIRKLVESSQPWLTEAYFASRFLLGLQEEFQIFLTRFHPVTVEAAYRLASIYEESLYLQYFPEIPLQNEELLMKNHVADIHKSVDRVCEEVMVGDLPITVVDSTWFNSEEEGGLDTLEIVAEQSRNNISANAVQQHSIPAYEVIHMGSTVDYIQLPVVRNVMEGEEPIWKSPSHEDAHTNALALLVSKEPKVHPPDIAVRMVPSVDRVCIKRFSSLGCLVSDIWLSNCTLVHCLINQMSVCQKICCSWVNNYVSHCLETKALISRYSPNSDYDESVRGVQHEVRRLYFPWKLGTLSSQWQSDHLREHCSNLGLQHGSRWSDLAELQSYYHTNSMKLGNKKPRIITNNFFCGIHAHIIFVRAVFGVELLVYVVYPSSCSRIKDIKFQLQWVLPKRCYSVLVASPHQKSLLPWCVVCGLEETTSFMMNIISVLYWPQRSGSVLVIKFDGSFCLRAEFSLHGLHIASTPCIECFLAKSAIEEEPGVITIVLLLFGRVLTMHNYNHLKAYGTWVLLLLFKEHKVKPPDLASILWDSSLSPVYHIFIKLIVLVAHMDLSLPPASLYSLRTKYSLHIQFAATNVYNESPVVRVPSIQVNQFMVSLFSDWVFITQSYAHINAYGARRCSKFCFFDSAVAYISGYKSLVHSATSSLLKFKIKSLQVSSSPWLGSDIRFTQWKTSYSTCFTLHSKPRKIAAALHWFSIRNGHLLLGVCNYNELVNIFLATFRVTLCPMGQFLSVAVSFHSNVMDFPSIKILLLLLYAIRERRGNEIQSLIGALILATKWNNIRSASACYIFYGIRLINNRLTYIVKMLLPSWYLVGKTLVSLHYGTNNISACVILWQASSKPIKLKGRVHGTKFYLPDWFRYRTGYELIQLHCEKSATCVVPFHNNNEQAVGIIYSSSGSAASIVVNNEPAIQSTKSLVSVLVNNRGMEIILCLLCEMNMSFSWCLNVIKIEFTFVAMLGSWVFDPGIDYTSPSEI